MQNNAIGAGGATGAAGAGGEAGGAGAAGNEQLTQAFDSAIQNAQKTLEISTKKGAELYALKQRPQ